MGLVVAMALLDLLQLGRREQRQFPLAIGCRRRLVLRAAIAQVADGELQVIDALGVDAEDALGTSIARDRLPEPVAVGLRTLDAVIGPLNVAARYVDEISKGAIPAKITATYSGDFNTIKENLNRQIEVINHKRGELEKHQEEHIRRLEKIAGLTADEAKAFGLVDEVFDRRPAVADDASMMR